MSRKDKSNKMKGTEEMSKARRIGFGGLLLSLLALPVYSQELNCTATPDCAALGYNKSEADCLEGAVKCPFNPSRVFCLRGGAGYNNFAIKAKVTNLNIVYSDGTNSANLTTGKDPIGVAIVTETNSGYNHGFIVARDQPFAATWADAIKGCNDYKTVGTEAGDWALINLEEAMYINGWDPSESSTGTNQYASLKSQMNKIPHAGRLGYSDNVSYCLSGSPDAGGTYLQGRGPACPAASGAGKIKVRVTAADLRYNGQSPMGCRSESYNGNYYINPTQCIADIEADATSNSVSFNGSVLKCGTGSYYTMSYCSYVPKNWTNYGNGNLSYNATAASSWAGTVPISSGFNSDFYWTINEYPGGTTQPYYIQLGATTGNRAILGGSSDKTKKSLYRCVLRF